MEALHIEHEIHNVCFLLEGKVERGIYGKDERKVEGW